MLRRLVTFFIAMTFSLSLMLFPVHASTDYYEETEFPYVLRHGDNYFFLDDNGDVSEMVGRIDLHLNDDYAINIFLESANVENEVKDAVLSAKKRLADDSTSANTLTIFSPDLLSHTRSVDYYTYNNVEMKRERVYAYNVGTGYQFAKHGTNAVNVAAAVTQILTDIAGSYIQLISLGDSLLGIYEAAVGGNVVSASVSDYTQVELIFNKIDQWTYGKLDGTNWLLGYYAQSITIKKIKMHQQFVVNNVGTQNDSTKTVNITRKPSSFDSPWQKAYLNLGNPVDEVVRYKIYGLTYYFP